MCQIAGPGRPIRPGPGGGAPSRLSNTEVHYGTDPAFHSVAIWTDNRNAPLHPFTGPADANAGGLVGMVDSGIVVPLLWQVYDVPLGSAPVFTNTTEWAFVMDQSDSTFGTEETAVYRRLVQGSTLSGRPGARLNAIVVYLVADFTGKPAQPTRRTGS